MSSSSPPFRPIAPAQPHMHIYAGACNPPRRAKRLRPDDPDPVSPLSSPSPPDDDDPPPRRRGRRPGTLSRAAREAQRKVNHSLIEKARRTKINDALATLRELVPPPPESRPDDSDDDDRPRPKPKAPAEKEFKLEILVRTVAYLQDLTDRVRQLERDGCPRCSEPISVAPDAKRRRCDSPSPSRLPSISAWLPSTEDQRPRLLTPSHSPVFDTATARPTQLPTPPTSATCAPATSFPLPPVLTLPSPSTFLPPATHIQPRFSGFAPRAKTSPIASPVYSPDDETAASLLLRISTTSSRSVVPARPVEAGATAGYALTPSKLLGLNAEG